MRTSEAPRRHPRWSALPSTRLIVVVFSCAVFFATPALAHPIHTSYAEADYRPESQKLEIALRLFTDDAEAALSGRAGRKISFDSTPAAELDALVFTYVRTLFTVKTRDGAVQALTWVGREFKDHEGHLWIYLQCPLPGGAAGARIRDRVLRDTFADQLNSVRMRDHSAKPVRQVTLLFTSDAEQSVAFR